MSLQVILKFQNYSKTGLDVEPFGLLRFECFDAEGNLRS